VIFTKYSKKGLSNLLFGSRKYKIFLNTTNLIITHFSFLSCRALHYFLLEKKTKRKQLKVVVVFYFWFKFSCKCITRKMKIKSNNSRNLGICFTNKFKFHPYVSLHISTAVEEKNK